MGAHPREIETLRFSGDRPEIFGIELADRNATERDRQTRARCLSRAVKIVPALFPDLAPVVSEVFRRLDPNMQAEAFVYSDNDIQASCVRLHGQAEVGVLLSSSLVQLLNPTELQFVVGHELGHYLLGHHRYPALEDASDAFHRYNLLELQRAAEFSADRVGFVCADSLDVAARAMIKTGTGLPDEYLRFDIGAYLSQLDELTQMGGYDGAIEDTHPMFPLRLRALMWLDMSNVHSPWTGRAIEPGLQADVIDRRIVADLSKVSGAAVETMREESLSRAEMWALMQLAMEDKRLSREEQSFLRRRFGEDIANKAIEFVRENGAEGIERKLEESMAKVRTHPVEQRQALLADLQAFANDYCDATQARLLLGGISEKLQLKDARSDG